jgi:type III restriction enzyme
LKIFFDDPVLPDDGVGGRNWHDDFQQISMHVALSRNLSSRIK